MKYNNTDEITANQPVVLHTGSTVIDLLAYIGAGCVGSWSPAPLRTASDSSDSASTTP